MYLLCSILCLIVLNLKPCFSQRRIINAIPSTEKRYMVYLIKGEESPTKYDAWICGGVIVKPRFIVTSAACVEDVKYLYAIAGYKKYVNARDINGNPCTKAKKKKIIMTCVPKPYEFDYPDVKKWARMDIAVAEVESPYDYNDNTYVSSGCSYPPNEIDFTTNRAEEAPGVSAVVLGWGHLEYFRQVTDKRDLNQELLQYSPVKIVEKSVCKEKWLPEMASMIDKYMICTFGAGNLDSEGNPWDGNPQRTLIGLEGCSRRRKRKLKPGEIDPCEYFPHKRTLRNLHFMADTPSRRHGFCQNDHGGPLIGFTKDKKDIFLGVQSAFLLDVDNKCLGPFLHTSTFCNGAFLDCIINGPNRRSCNNTLLRMGFKILRRRISWKNHPDGPALNERSSELLIERKTRKEIMITASPRARPAIPLHDLYRSRK